MTHRDFAQSVARLATAAASWSADMLDLPEVPGEPALVATVEQFLSEMHQRLDWIERLAREGGMSTGGAGDPIAEVFRLEQAGTDDVLTAAQAWARARRRAILAANAGQKDLRVEFGVLAGAEGVLLDAVGALGEGKDVRPEADRG